MRCLMMFMLIVLCYVATSSKLENFFAQNGGLVPPDISIRIHEMYSFCEFFVIFTNTNYSHSQINLFPKAFFRVPIISYDLNNIEISSNMNSRPYCVILICEKERNLKEIALALDSNGLNWDYVTKFLIICSKECSMNKFLIDFSTSNGTSNLINALVIDFWNDNGVLFCSSARIFIKLNFAKDSLPKVFKYFCKVNLHKEVLSISLLQNAPLTYSKNAKDFEKLEERETCSIDELSGMEVLLLKSLMNRFNFSVKLLLPKDGRKHGNLYKNGTSTGSINQTIEGEVKIRANLFPAGQYMNLTCTPYVWPPYSDASAIIIHKSLLPRNLVNPFDIFTMSVYLACGLSFLATAVAWRIITDFSECSHTKPVILSLFNILTGRGIERPLFIISERLLLMNYLIHTFIILSVFQGNLINIFNKLDQFSDFKDLKQFVDYNIPVLPYRYEYADYFKFNEPHGDSVGKRFSQRIDSALELTGKTNISYDSINFTEIIERKIAILSSISMAKRKISEDLRRNSGSTNFLISHVKASIRHYDMIYFVNKELRFLPYINHHILDLATANLVEKMYEDSVRDEMRQMVLKLDHKKHVHKLTMFELQIGFVLYFMGIAISTSVFIFEIWYKNQFFLMFCKPYPFTH